MRRFLVVANQTLGGAALAAEIRRRMAEGPCSFHIVVPATRPTDHLVWTEGEAHAMARERLKETLEWFEQEGAEATGHVGDEKPMLAVEDSFIGAKYDEVILSTLPAGVSRWLKQDLPARVRRKVPVPVTHVISEPVEVSESA